MWYNTCGLCLINVVTNAFSNHYIVIKRTITIGNSSFYLLNYRTYERKHTMSFKELGISSELINKLKKLGITEPTPIQKQSIALVLNHKDVLASSKTGSGKTLAYLLPIVESLSKKSTNIEALILAPTRELALQITEMAVKLTSKEAVLAVYGGQDINKQLKKLHHSIKITVATPGRLLDLIGRQAIDLSHIKFLVLDEVDQMLLMGFKNEVEMIKRELPNKKQTLCYSATVNAGVKKLVYKMGKSFVNVTVKENSADTSANLDIKQEIICTTDRRKQSALFHALDEDNPYMAIIFCRTKRRVDALYDAMKQKKYNCIKLHSDILQSKRERMLKEFRKGDVQYLIATDVVARGIDVTGVTHVYNYDCPESFEDYVHRIGRTGRAGNDGYTCLFFTERNSPLLKEIEQKLKRPLDERIVCDELN